MPGRLQALPGKPIAGHVASGYGSPDHPMRVMTRRAAGLHAGGWDNAARAEVAGYFDALAPEWHTRASPERDAVVDDAMARGLPHHVGVGGVCVELGSGIGTYTPVLALHWRQVLCVELSLEMLRRAPRDVGHRLLADGAQLPLVSGTLSAAVLVNCFLFPTEVDRVLAPGGVVVWVNSSGAETPIHLPAEDVVEALPGQWEGVHSVAGVGIWSVLWRSTT